MHASHWNNSNNNKTTSHSCSWVVILFGRLVFKEMPYWNLCKQSWVDVEQTYTGTTHVCICCATDTGKGRRGAGVQTQTSS